MKDMQETVLEQEIQQLQRKVKVWAELNELWFDCDLYDYNQRVKPIEWDGNGFVTVLAADGPLATSVMSREDQVLAEEFDNLLVENGFWYEQSDHTELWIYPHGHALDRELKEYMRWKWICSLIKPDFDTLDQELYAHFGKRPDQLKGLNWRDFEKIVAALLESQGYQVELGPGWNDGGIDLKLIQRDPIGDILTLVQVKRYNKIKIRLEAVQALHGVTMADGAANGMFVTTSAYLPSAERFADRDNVPMTLHTSSDVQQWCVDACNGIVEDKSKLVSEEHVTRILEKARREDRQILHSSGGYNMLTNQFAIVLKESTNAALLLNLPRRITEHDGYGQRGLEVPDVQSVPPISDFGPNRIRRARRGGGGSSRRFWDGRDWYSPWDGKPVHFHGD